MHLEETLFSLLIFDEADFVIIPGMCILGDPGAVSRVDKMFLVKVFCKIDLTENFHHEHFIDPTNRPWVSEDVACVNRLV